MKPPYIIDLNNSDRKTRIRIFTKLHELKYKWNNSVYSMGVKSASIVDPGDNKINLYNKRYIIVGPVDKLDKYNIGHSNIVNKVHENLKIISPTEFLNMNESSIKLTNIIAESQLSFDMGNNEVRGIFQKFLKLSPLKKSKSKRYGNAISYQDLMFLVDDQGNPTGALFQDDRVHDFLVHMDKKGFGPNIFGTLTKLAKTKKMQGYTTVLTF
jgi:hypothetical protein